MNSKFWKFFRYYDRLFVGKMRHWGITLLRIALGIVFLWFGVLKVIDASPVSEIIKKTYAFLPLKEFLVLLGIWEVCIGLGLIFKIFLRTTLFLLWLQMAGIFGSIFFHPLLFFSGNPFFLTLEGEFIIKNIIIVAASIVIGGHRIES